MANYDRLFDVAGKSAIVTGASSGLGEMFATVLAERGANVVLVARRTDKLRQVAEKIAKGGGAAFPLTCDVADSVQVKDMVEKAVQHYGRVDILVSNAGINPDVGMAEKISNEVFEKAMQVNLLGVWYCCQAVGKRMLADGKGSIINIASIAGLNGIQNFPIAYQATKAGVINLTRNLACSWGDRGVRVNAIAPGFFPSEMTDAWLANPVFLNHVQKIAPMGRIGSPLELAGALLLLASDASSFITGHTLVVDGGASASMGLTFTTDAMFKLFAEALPDGLGERIMPA